MAGGVEKILRRRISSVESTKKITRAMELIATTRVAKAQQRANASRPYAEKITQVIEDLASHSSGSSHPLFRSVENSQKVGVVVISSDRGLAGPYNSQVIRMAETELMETKKEGKGYTLITIGKKAKDYFSFRNYKIAESYEKISDTPTYDNAKEVATTIKDLFITEQVDEVRLIYTEFISLGRQKTVARRFLPLLQLNVIATENVGDKSATATASFEFEPSPDEILETLLHRYIESRLFSALLDSAASEHANRQRAMKAATDNAEELITKLTRQMNRARQDAITTEIMEIVGGAEALQESRNLEDLDQLIVNN